jgi:UDP-N-acetylmuramate dehydrogenase
MTLTEHLSLAKLTTFKVGGSVRVVADCFNEQDVQAAVAYARDCGLSWYVLGGGSNVLADDGGYDGMIIRPLLSELTFDMNNDSPECIVTVGAGVKWDTLVEEGTARELWGLENLAGIPGSVGGAPVQNIGAYGADVSDTLLFVDALNTKTNEVQRFTNEECAFNYRDSRFKHDASLIILRVAFTLTKNGSPRTNYADLTTRVAQGTVLDTPHVIANTVREIRARKFPDLAVEGTAGSFFKNPIIDTACYEELKSRFPELPGFVVEGSVPPRIKVSLAWILDHVLHLKGFSQGAGARLYENQPIVLAAQVGTTSASINALAREVEEQVYTATGITIEREVRSLPALITSE